MGHNIGEESVFLQTVHTLIPNTTSVMVLSMKKGNAMKNVAQRNHIGVNGKTGLPVVGVVEVELLLEGGTAINPNVHIPIIRPAMEMIMNIKGVMSNVVQKSHTGVPGGTGLFVAKHVEVVYPSESDNVINLNVHIPFIRNVLEMITKK